MFDTSVALITFYIIQSDQRSFTIAHIHTHTHTHTRMYANNVIKTFKEGNYNALDLSHKYGKLLAGLRRFLFCQNIIYQKTSFSIG